MPRNSGSSLSPPPRADSQTASIPTVAPRGNLAARAQALLDAPTPAAAFDLFANEINAYGFTHCFAGRVSSAVLTDLALTPFFFSWPFTPRLEGYVRERYFANDPVMARARLTNRPFYWSEVYDDLDPEQERTVELFREGGLSHGYCVPIDRTRGVAGIASMGRDSDFHLPRETRIEIEVLSRHVFERIDQLFAESVKPPRSLTPRERAVLVLVGEGKTNWEIGAILDISEYSVRDYMRNMADKLQTANRTHTVVRAVQLGLIAV